MIQLGCIADDFTGATDLANNLVRAGMRVVQTIGMPTAPLAEAADAVVVALKSRTIAPAEAVAQSLAACRWLRAQGASQIYFKVCSTFDSTARGNIGPVSEALMDELDAPFCVVTPAFPENGRTVFKGHLFVGDLLLSDSPMRLHPLTPMTDANLVRVLQAQLSVPRGRQVGLVERSTVAAGGAAIRARIEALKARGMTLAIADAVDNADLWHLAEALKGELLMTAGSGLAIGLPAQFGIQPAAEAAWLPVAGGAQAIVSGSCSAATQAQVAAFRQAGGEAFEVAPLRIASGADLAAEALAWALPRLPRGPVLVYATAAPEAVREVQQRLGVEQAGAMVEDTLGRVARGLVEHGVAQLVVAGGETSGACVQALGITQMRIGPQIDPGVPWCHAASPAAGAAGLHLALKSGNFGGTDFFTRAFATLRH
ncbi:MAG: four-carbon acid sugar kinase family protein [Burkholderiales bacterium]|nr:four-carbon acid sugar kinase family protein [Burkholderiales bacterium]